MILLLLLFACLVTGEPQVFNVTSTVYLDVSINGLPAGRIVLGLYGEVAPRTSENFRGLCTGEYGPRSNGKPLTYKGTRFSRIIPGFVVQGGDVGWSIYGKKFDDETFVVSQNRPGILVMANAGRNTNQSQFYITTANVAYLDKKLVAFGTVLEGMDVVYMIDKCGTAKGVPKCKVVIADSGELPKTATTAPIPEGFFVPPSLR
ncbi:hypothetical protein WA577_007628, partial [Blastocystis sp. JDR]